MQRVGLRRYSDLLLLLVILTGGFALRVDGLNQMSAMLSYDEAYNGIDALSILQNPRLVPFFPENFGRESAWMYWLVPWLKALGTRPFTLRVVSVVTGFLTLGAVYALASELLAKREAVWSAATLAVLYWHVHLSHLALRAILFPLFGTLAFLFLLRAYRTNRLKYWVAGGALVGLLLYTYFAASLWVAYALLMAGWWFLRESDKRKGAVLSILIAIAFAIPLSKYTLNNPQLALGRVSDVGVLDWEGITHNLGLWARAWFHEGHLTTLINLPGRPILDLPLGIVFVVGLVGLVSAARRRSQTILWILGLALLSVLPSIISDNAPHPLRAIGLVVPIAFVGGIGAQTIEKQVAFLKQFAVLVPIVLFAWAGLNTAQDFRAVLAHPDMFRDTEMHIIDGASFVASNMPLELPMYFSPFSAFHPLPRFLSTDMSPRQTGAFVARECMIVSASPAAYFSLTMFDAAFQDNLAQWADMEVVYQEPSRTDPRYAVFRAVAREEFLAAWEEQASIVFADEVEVRFAEPPSDIVRAGDVARFTFALRPLQVMSRFYAIFVHLQSDPSPYEGGPLLSQRDEQLCPSHPTPVWQLNETIIQTVQLPIPEDIEPGNYTIAIGLYDHQSGQRLQVTEPVGQQDFIEMYNIDVSNTDS